MLEYQNSFIEEIKDKIKNDRKKILFFPKTTCGSDNLNDYYCKPVIVVAPECFPGFTGTCPQCCDQVKLNGWQTNNKYVHGLRHGKL
jgi:hypothetical protein